MNAFTVSNGDAWLILAVVGVVLLTLAATGRL